MSTTDNLLLPLVATHQAQKEVTVNDSFAALDAALTESVAIPATDGVLAVGATDMLSAAQLVLVHGDETADFTAELAAIKRELIITNSTAYDVTVACSGAGSGAGEAIIDAGASAKVYCDGTQIFAVAGGSGAPGVNVFTGLLDAPSSYSGAAGRGLRVNATATGLEFGSPSAVTLLNYQAGTSYTLTLADAGALVALDNAAPITLSVPADADELIPTGSEIQLLQMGDGQVTVDAPSGVDVLTNSSLSLHSRYAVARLRKLDADVWLLEGRLAGLADVTSFIGLDDVPASYAGAAGRVVRVNGAADGLEFGGAGADLSINAQTGTTYTLALADAGGLVTFDNSSAITVEVPESSTVAFPVGTQILLAQINAGQVTVTPESSNVDILSPETTSLRKVGAQAALVQIATDVWLLEGNLESL